jgi:hypothetical protein
MLQVIAYDIAALLSRFDVRADTTVTGMLSKWIGELILLDALTNALHHDGAGRVEFLGKPHRDDLLFEFAGSEKPRDLDQWLLLDNKQLAAVECKHWTSSGKGGKTVPETGEERADFARREWQKLLDGKDGFGVTSWNNVNKVALPLRPPNGHDSREALRARRILAIWYPKSEDGRSYWSRAPRNVKLPRSAVDVPIEVFSASLYLRQLQSEGHAQLPAARPDSEGALGALEEIIRRG